MCRPARSLRPQPTHRSAVGRAPIPTVFETRPYTIARPLPYVKQKPLLRGNNVGFDRSAGRSWVYGSALNPGGRLAPPLEWRLRRGILIAPLARAIVPRTRIQGAFSDRSWKWGGLVRDMSRRKERSQSPVGRSARSAARSRRRRATSANRRRSRADRSRRPLTPAPAGLPAPSPTRPAATPHGRDS